MEEEGQATEIQGKAYAGQALATGTILEVVDTSTQNKLNRIRAFIRRKSGSSEFAVGETVFRCTKCIK